MSERKYEIFGRSPLPRNKYGIIYDLNMVSSGGSSSMFGSSSPVGSEMVDIKDFTGATDILDGVRGLVPAPIAGQQDYFLQGTGSWKEIPAYKWMSEFPSGGGLEKSGLQVNGDLNVLDTLSTMNLNVQGMAHFWSLIIDQVKANGGQLIVSPSMFHVDFVGKIEYYPVFTADSPLYTIVSMRKDIDTCLRACNVDRIKVRRVYQRNDDGEKRIFNEVQVGDMMRCRSFNIKEGSYSNVSNKDYWTFVVKTGEEIYTDDEGKEYECFYCDLAYSFLTTTNHNIPIGSLLHDDGGIDYPNGWSEEDITRLKSISQETLNGDPNVDTEYIEDDEKYEIQNNILKIRGVDDVLDKITGLEASNSLTDNELMTGRVNAMLNLINQGTNSNVNDTVSDNANDLSQLIMTGQFSNNDNHITQDIDTQGVNLSRDILSDNTDLSQSDLSLSVSTVKPHKMFIANDVTLEKDFIADEDLFDGDVVVYHKGDIVPEGTLTKGDWLLLDYQGDTNFKEVDSEGVEGDVSQENLDQITGVTNTTQFGTSRDEDTALHSEDREWLFGYGKFNVSVGDDLSCLGHLYDNTRQNSIVLSSTDPIDPDLRAPAIAQYNNIDIFGVSISKYRITSIAANGNEFKGSFLINNNGKFIDVNEKINLFMTDITSGLETVGIHLDGDKSTITMVGSIDIKQHSSTSYDTINVYDKFDTKRVEIQPFDIPKRDSEESQIKNSTLTVPYNYVSFNALSQYITKDKSTEWDGPFWYYHVYNYYLKNYTITVQNEINLGQYSSYNKFNINDLKFNLKVKPWFMNAWDVTDRGYASNPQQSITTFTIRLKRNGSTVQTFNLLSSIIVPQSDYYSTEGIFHITIPGTFINYMVPQNTSGSYSIEIIAGAKIYAHDRFAGDKYDYSNYYYTVDCSATGNMRMQVDTQNLDDPDRDTSGDTSGRKMTIGTNGLVFSGGLNKYFYAADDGYEMKWGDVSLSFDNTYGLKQNKKVYSAGDIYTKYNSVIPKDCDVIINVTNSSYTLKLRNDDSLIGNGRVMVIRNVNDGSINIVDYSDTTRSGYVSSNMIASWREYDSSAEDYVTRTAGVTSKSLTIMYYAGSWYQI